FGAPGSGILFRAGEGVGTVTKPGLPLTVGEPAINPVPRRMMSEVVKELAGAHGRQADVEITIGVPGGVEMARRTWNGRLGILGGLSILGTTGVVHPYSCSAWIASIHRGIDVARANGLQHVAACTGSTSEAGIRRLYELPDIALIDMGDFAGGMLKYLRRHPVPRVTIAGGFAKIAKLAGGAGDLHSDPSPVDNRLLAQALSDLGATAALLDTVHTANTANEVLAAARAAGLPLGDRIAAQARGVAKAMSEGRLAIEVAIFDREGGLAGRASFDNS